MDAQSRTPQRSDSYHWCPEVCENGPPPNSYSEQVVWCFCTLNQPPSKLFGGICPTSLVLAMLRHCPIPRFASSRKKMPKASGKEKAPKAPLECPTLGSEVAKEPVPPQKVLKIFRINIIAHGLPFCRRQVSLDLGMCADYCAGL